MWLLEHLDNLFEGRQLWLRPGKRYLFGRTVSEPGQLAISDKTISRKHLTIEIGPVTQGDGKIRNSRSTVTIEDLSSKIGTVVDGVQIRGQKHVLAGDSCEIKIGHCPQPFRITWKSVVLTFSFTNKELRADPWAKLRESLEQLDVKCIADYDIALTTHVVTKKRNTSKGLQALINGRYIVTDTFVTAIAEAAIRPGGPDGCDPSPLEQDFDRSWPDALQHLPPPGEEPKDRPVEAFAPDGRRKEIFDGYTFIFYEKKQYDNLCTAIANGKGKVLLKEVSPGETDIDDFARYVKGVAREKGSGELEGGGEGEGVVVVSYLPPQGHTTYPWYSNFQSAVSQGLGQYLIDQRDFLDAILTFEPAMLRRPVGIDPSTQAAFESQTAPAASHGTGAMIAHGPKRGGLKPTNSRPSEDRSSQKRQPVRTRAAAKSRFKGFGGDLDSGDDLPSQDDRGSAAYQTSVLSSGGNQAVEDRIGGRSTAGRQLKRPASSAVPDWEHDIFEGVAPTAAAVKRQRIERGEEPIARLETTTLHDGDDEALGAPPSGPVDPRKNQSKTGIGDIDILELARQRRDEAEARAKAEREALAQLPDDIDPAQIRRLTIVEEIQPREATARRTERDRADDIADGRWDPTWNGRRNFKMFRGQGSTAGRPPPRVIVPLEEVKTKEYGIGDDYWLEDDSQRKRSDRDKQSQSQSQGQVSTARRESGKDGNSSVPGATLVANDSDEDLESRVDSEAAVGSVRGLIRADSAREAESRTDGSSSQRRAGTRSRGTQPRQSGKRAAASPTSSRPSKKPRQTGGAGPSDDDSEDELKFRFGRRR